MNVDIPLRKNKGLTLIELLVALGISAILFGGMYKTFINQQKTYTVQEEVVDMQQNIRGGINLMMREIRMAGFGIGNSTILNNGFQVAGGNSFSNIVNPDLNNPAGSLTILLASETGGTLVGGGIVGQFQITVSSLTDSQGNAIFDTNLMKYISIGGVESHTITNISGNTLTLDGGLTYNYLPNQSATVFGIRAINYQVGLVNGIPTLLRDENVGAGPQPQADSIEQLQYGYFDVNDNQVVNPPANAQNIRIVQVSLTARTNTPDPDLKNGDGYRRRQISSNIHLENMGL